MSVPQSIRNAENIAVLLHAMIFCDTHTTRKTNQVRTALATQIRGLLFSSGTLEEPDEDMCLKILERCIAIANKNSEDTISEARVAAQNLPQGAREKTFTLYVDILARARDRSMVFTRASYWANETGISNDLRDATLRVAIIRAAPVSSLTN